MRGVAIVWTEARLEELRRRRRGGEAWGVIGRAMGLSEQVAWQKGRTLGLAGQVSLPRVVPSRRPEPAPVATFAELQALVERERLPLAAGDAVSWSAITAGTSLEGVPFEAGR